MEVAKTFAKNPDNVIIASAQNFPDGLCGGPLAYVMNAPLILTNPTVDAGRLAPAKTYLADMTISSGKALGGGGALADDVVRTVFGMDSGDKIAGEIYN